MMGLAGAMAGPAGVLFFMRCAATLLWHQHCQSLPWDSWL